MIQSIENWVCVIIRFFSYNREEIEEEDDVEGDYNTLL